MSATDIAKSVDVDLDMIQEQAASVAEELIETAKMKEGQILAAPPARSPPMPSAAIPAKRWEKPYSTPSIR